MQQDPHHDGAHDGLLCSRGGRHGDLHHYGGAAIEVRLLDEAGREGHPKGDALRQPLQFRETEYGLYLRLRASAFSLAISITVGNIGGTCKVGHIGRFGILGAHVGCSRAVVRRPWIPLAGALNMSVPSLLAHACRCTI